MQNDQIFKSTVQTKRNGNKFGALLRTTATAATAASMLLYYGCSANTNNLSSTNSTGIALTTPQNSNVKHVNVQQPAIRFYKTLSPFYGLPNNDKIYNQHAYVTFPASHRWLEIITKAAPDNKKNTLMGALLLNGMTDTKWWCQIGLAQFPRYKGPISRYFILVNVYNPDAKLMSNPVYSLKQSIRQNDTIRLCMRITDDRVLLSGDDLTTNHGINLLLNMKAKRFIESATVQNSGGSTLLSPTGVMFEGYTTDKNGYAGSMPISAIVVEPELSKFKYVRIGEDIIPIRIIKQNQNLPALLIFERHKAQVFGLNGIDRRKGSYSYRFAGSKTEIKYGTDPIMISFYNVGQNKGLPKR